MYRSLIFTTVKATVHAVKKLKISQGTRDSLDEIVDFLSVAQEDEEISKEDFVEFFDSLKNLRNQSVKSYFEVAHKIMLNKFEGFQFQFSEPDGRDSVREKIEGDHWALFSSGHLDYCKTWDRNDWSGFKP